uniref:Uncharacterized protein n=1 Tax=viral metagenome TaxID=1070528 RepID=A0A6C0BHM0_9ZZZZ
MKELLVIVAIALIILLFVQRQVEEAFTDTTDRIKKITDPPLYTNKYLPNPLAQGPLKGNPNLTWNENAVTTKWIKDLKGYLPSI